MNYRNRYNPETQRRIQSTCAHRDTRPVGYDYTACTRCGVMFAVVRA